MPGETAEAGIVAAAAFPDGVFICFDSGLVAAYRWADTFLPAMQPSLDGSWWMPSMVGKAQVVAATHLKAPPAAFAVVGSETGSLVQFGQSWSGQLQVNHSPAAVTAVLLVPQLESAAEAFYSETDQAAWLFSADSSGKVLRIRVDAAGSLSRSSATETCAELQSSVLSMETC
eukprot:2904831-Amphidinium_carterae.1